MDLMRRSSASSGGRIMSRFQRWLQMSALAGIVATTLTWIGCGGDDTKYLVVIEYER